MKTVVANYLYLNGIDYEYEPMYQYRILDANKPYTPDFRIKQGDKTAYIEHFGITENGQNNRYTPEELERYKARVNDKIRLHRKHRTDLIYTFSAYNDRRDFLEHLEEQLLQHGFELRPRPVSPTCYWTPVFAVYSQNHFISYLKMLSQFQK